MAEKKLYTYKGAVRKFDTIVASNWSGRTMAVSARQASANLAYQYKMSNGLVGSARVTLCGVPQVAAY